MKQTNPDAIIFRGFDEAIVGVTWSFVRRDPVFLYDWDRCVEIVVALGSSFEEAIDYVSANVEGSWLGEGTPAFCRIAEENEDDR